MPDYVDKASLYWYKHCCNKTMNCLYALGKLRVVVCIGKLLCSAHITCTRSWHSESKDTNCCKQIWWKYFWTVFWFVNLLLVWFIKNGLISSCIKSKQVLVHFCIFILLEFMQKYLPKVWTTAKDITQSTNIDAGSLILTIKISTANTNFSHLVAQK